MCQLWGKSCSDKCMISKCGKHGHIARICSCDYHNPCISSSSHISCNSMQTSSDVTPYKVAEVPTFGGLLSFTINICWYEDLARFGETKVDKTEWLSSKGQPIRPSYNYSGVWTWFKSVSQFANLCLTHSNQHQCNYPPDISLSLLPYKLSWTISNRCWMSMQKFYNQG